MATTYTDNLKLRMPAPGDFDWDDEHLDNMKIHDMLSTALKSRNRIISGLVVSDGGLLDADYSAGVVDVDGTRYTPSGSSIVLTASSKNYIYVNDSGVVSVSTTILTSEFALMALVDTNATTIDRIADLRTLGYTVFQLPTGVEVDEFSSDGTLAGDSDTALPTEKAVKTYVDELIRGENLILNPQFAINQDVYTFGTPVGTAFVYLLDGWTSDSTSGEITDNLDGSFTVVDLVQILADRDDLDGVEVTISAVVNSGTLTVTHGGANSSADLGSFSSVGDITSSVSSQTFTLDIGVKSYPAFKITGSAEFHSLKIELGVTQTPYAPRSFMNELELCQRQFFKTYPQDSAPGEIVQTGKVTSYTWNSGTFRFWFVFLFPVTMRATPTITAYSPNTGDSGKMRDDTNTVDITCINVASSATVLQASNNQTMTTAGLGKVQLVAVARI